MEQIGEKASGVGSLAEAAGDFVSVHANAIEFGVLSTAARSQALKEDLQPGMVLEIP